MKLPKVATAKQRLLVEYGLQNPYSLLAADPRLGKSAAVIWLQQHRRVNCLVVCPSYLILNWKKEILKWAPNASVTTFRKGSEIYEPCDSDFVVISYDLVQKAEHLFDWCDMVVCDEIHNIKSMTAKRTQFIHKSVFENSVRYVHGLTGTPIKNRVKEFYSLLALMYYQPGGPVEFLDKYPDEISFAEKFSYRQQFDIRVKSKRGAQFRMPVVKYEGLRNSSELKSWLKGRYIRLRAEKGDLPPISYKDILISDSPNKKLLAAFEAFFEGEDTHLVRPDVKVEAALQKVPFTIRYVENLVETVDCCLIYSDHKEPVKRLAAHFGVPAITGEMNPSKRAQLVNDFQKGKLDILCATIGSLKEGHDLFRSKHIVLNDLCWVPGDIFQVINRIRALGKKEPRVVHRLFGSPQDEKISAAIERKMDVINRAT